VRMTPTSAGAYLHPLFACAFHEAFSALAGDVEMAPSFEEMGL
jgi:hypothetical protein